MLCYNQMSLTFVSPAQTSLLGPKPIYQTVYSAPLKGCTKISSNSTHSRQFSLQPCSWACSFSSFSYLHELINSGQKRPQAILTPPLPLPSSSNLSLSPVNDHLHIFQISHFFSSLFSHPPTPAHPM